MGRVRQEQDGVEAVTRKLQIQGGLVPRVANQRDLELLLPALDYVERIIGVGGLGSQCQDAGAEQENQHAEAQYRAKGRVRTQQREERPLLLGLSQPELRVPT